MSATGCFRHAAAVVTAVTAVALGMPPIASGCGLEPAIKGGFTVSHPGSLDIAVAVADARRAGLLPQAEPNAASNEVQLRTMLADLRHLQSRLNKVFSGTKQKPGDHFSLVLVGPGLWSHFYMTPGGVLADYHTDGPLDEKVVVLTHHTALRALLGGNLSVKEATELGLLAFTGSDTDAVENVFRLVVHS